MSIKPLLAAVAVAVLTLSACTNPDGSGPGTKQTVGALGGAALGGWAGSQIGSGKGQLAATAAGAIIGMIVGSEVGRGLDELDQRKMAEAQQQATTAPIGETIVWNNPNSNNSGTVTPTRDGYRQTSAGQEYCREFQHTVNVGGQRESAYGVACRQPDGSWEIQ